jgi:hypothetical protein
VIVHGELPAGERLVLLALVEGYESRRIKGLRRYFLGCRSGGRRARAVMDVGGMCHGRVSAS